MRLTLIEKLFTGHLLPKGCQMTLQQAEKGKLILSLSKPLNDVTTMQVCSVEVKVAHPQKANRELLMQHINGSISHLVADIKKKKRVAFVGTSGARGV